MASSSIYFSRAKCADTEKRAVPFGVQLKRASAEEARLLRKLEDASLKGDEGKTRFYKGCYLRSFAAKLVAVVRAGRMLKAKGRPHLSDEQALGLARDLRLSQLCTEEVRVFPKLKDGGTSYRPMQSFGQEHRARKWLLTRVLNATAKLDRRQYGVQGGRTAACKQVLEAMRTCKFAVQIDIKNFFPSVNRNWLGQKLGIGRELVERNLLSTNAELRVRDGDRYPYGYAGMPMGPETMVADARRGLPQGASSSPIIGEFVVANILRAVPEGLQVINYCDNFVILGQTRREVEEALRTLSSAVTQSPAGPFRLHVYGIRRCADGFDFLGYQFRRRQGVPLAVPTRVAMEKGTRRFCRKIVGAYHGWCSQRDAWRSVQAWTNAYPLWLDREKVIQTMLLRLALDNPSLSATVEQLLEPLVLILRTRALAKMEVWSADRAMRMSIATPSATG